MREHIERVGNLPDCLLDSVGKTGEHIRLLTFCCTHIVKRFASLPVPLCHPIERFPHCIKIDIMPYVLLALPAAKGVEARDLTAASKLQRYDLIRAVSLGHGLGWEAIRDTFDTLFRGM